MIHRSLVSGYLYFAAGFAHDHPEAVDEIVAAVIRALDWMGTTPARLEMASAWGHDEAGRLGGDIYQLGLDQYRNLVLDDVVIHTANPAMLARDLEDGGMLQLEFDFLQDLDKIPASATWEETRACFDATIVGRLRAEMSSQAHRYQYDESTD